MIIKGLYSGRLAQRPRDDLHPAQRGTSVKITFALAFNILSQRAASGMQYVSIHSLCCCPCYRFGRQRNHQTTYQVYFSCDMGFCPMCLSANNQHVNMTKHNHPMLSDLWCSLFPTQKIQIMKRCRGHDDRRHLLATTGNRYCSFPAYIHRPGMKPDPLPQIYHLRDDTKQNSLVYGLFPGQPRKRAVIHWSM